MIEDKRLKNMQITCSLLGGKVYPELILFQMILWTSFLDRESSQVSLFRDLDHLTKKFFLLMNFDLISCNKYFIGNLAYSILDLIFLSSLT